MTNSVKSFHVLICYLYILSSEIASCLLPLSNVFFLTTFLCYCSSTYFRCVHIQVPWCTWRCSKITHMEVGSLLSQWGLRGQTQIVWFGGRCFYLLSNLDGLFFFLKKNNKKTSFLSLEFFLLLFQDRVSLCVALAVLKLVL